LTLGQEPPQGRFEAGRVLLPVEALWLADFESELLWFPSGRYDDQVDAFMLFLDWFSENEPNINMTWVKPIVITRADMGLTPLIKDWRPFDLSNAAFLARGNLLDIGDGAGNDLIKPTSAARNRRETVTDVHLFSHCSSRALAAGQREPHQASRNTTIAGCYSQKLKRL